MVSDGHNPASQARSRRFDAPLLMLIALVHGLIYAFGVPPWQAPDEPMLFEYAALFAELGRPPTPLDRSPELEAGIAASLSGGRFFERLTGQTPSTPPATLDEARALVPMPRQVGGDPPLAFALAAIPLRLTPGWSVEARLYLLRALNAALLPLAAACTYLAARALAPGQATPTGSTAQAGDAVALVPVAAAALVALQPMYVFIGAAVNNDGLANALGALLCLLLLRAVRRGLPGRDLLALGALALLGLAIKRSTLPFMLITALLGLIWLLRLILRRGHGAVPRRVMALGLGLGAFLACAALLTGQLQPERAAGWQDALTLLPAARIAGAGGHALALGPGEEAIQVLPDVATLYLRNNVLRVGATLWSEGPATGRLLIYSGDRRREQPFAVTGTAQAQISAAIPSYAGDVRVGVVADSGRLLVGSLWAQGVGLPGNLLRNGDLSRAALDPASPLRPLLAYLRAEELAWALAGTRLRWGLPWADWLSWLFASYWGQFGWFNLALVRGTAWAWAIGTACAWGLIGATLALVRAPSPTRGQLVALLALLSASLVPVVLNALVDPYPIQQGRYLFPSLPALAILLAYGQSALLPARAHRAWLLAWLGFWLVFAAAALLFLASRFYGGR